MGTKGGFGGGVSQFTTNPNVLKLLKGGTFGPSAHRSCQSTKQKHFHGPVGVGLLSELHLLKYFAMEGTCRLAQRVLGQGWVLNLAW